MYGKTSSVLSAMVVVVIAVACQEPPTALDEPTSSAAESTDVTELPAGEAMAAVARYEAGDCPGPDTRGTGFLCESKDVVARYFVGHYQVDDVFFCGGSSFFPRWNVQEMASGNATRYHSTLNDAAIFIYDWDALIAAAGAGELCAHSANEWLYRGSHDMVFNEVVRSDGSFTANWTGQGFVYDQDGRRYRYREHQVETDEGFTKQVIRVQ